MNPSHKKLMLWIVVAIVGAIVIGGIVWWISSDRGETSQEIAPGQTLFTPKAGEIVSGFPRDLIQEKDFSVVQSYRIEYANDNVSQPFVKYNSKWNMEEN